MQDTWAIIVAGGRGERFGANAPKQFLPLGDGLVLDHSLRLFTQLGELGGVVLVLPEEFVAEYQERLQGSGVKVCVGGSTRQGSVAAGLRAVGPETQFVAIHDAARPLCTPEILQRTLAGAREVGAAISAVALADTLKAGSPEGLVERTVPRDAMYRVQTPQVFRKSLLEECLEWAAAEGLDATDEATLVERMGRPVKIVEGSEFNFKITRPSDLQLAELILGTGGGGNAAMAIRIGEGYDVHAFEKDRPLILGGVTIPFELGLKGHSDADALCHAVGDALLGAAALGDLGKHFPDTDPQYRGISSLKLLESIREMLKKKGFQVMNVDATLICQRPKLAGHIPTMRENLAKVLGTALDQISVKATTEEGLGFTGQMAGLAARAVVLVGPRN